MKKMSSITVIGAGALGSSFIHLLTNNQHKVLVYDISSKNIVNLKNILNQKQYQKISILNSLSDIPENTLILPAIPSAVWPTFFSNNKKLLSKNYILCVSKGFWPNTTQTISQYLSQHLESNRLAVLSGPTFAHEIIAKQPTSCLIGSTNKSLCKQITKLMNNDYFLGHTTTETIGLEIGGILKNCYSAGLGYIYHQTKSHNSVSLAIINITQEIKPLFSALNIPQKYIFELSFLGDLIATGLNPISRNYQFGYNNFHFQNKTTESQNNFLQAKKLAKKNNLNLPILKTIYQIINDKQEFKDLIKVLLSPDR